MRGKIQTNLEKEMDSVLQEIGLLDASYDYPIRSKYGYRIDFAFPDINLGIECDGEYWHPPKNEHDRKRDAFMKHNKKWKILRFTGNDIINNRELVKAKITVEIIKQNMKKELPVKG